MGSCANQVDRIEGGLVLTPEGFLPRPVFVSGERIGKAEVTGPMGGAVLDAAGGYVVPGFIDLHFHGCAGADFSDGDPEGLHRIAAHEARCGVTAICPASMTLPEDVLTRAFSTAADFVPGEAEAELVGINMEGPYISPDKVGAQNPGYVRPADLAEFDRLQVAAKGLVKLVDVAPEVPGNLEFVEAVSQRVRVSVAHTCAGYDCAREAFERGAHHMTHLYNAMPGLHHREPGPIAAGAENPAVMAELIADGVHVHPAMVRLAFELFGPDRVVLVSDSLRASGLGDGSYELGGQEFTVRDNRATLADGTLAGSVSNLADCVRTAVLAMGVPLEDAVRAATANPARALGIDDIRGSIEPGKMADLLVLDDDLRVRAVVLRGRRLV